MRLSQAIRAWARRIKQDAVMLWFACKHPQTPLLPKWVAALAVAYALSPIDLIPDFIPVLGYLDDAILVPALVWLAVKWLPLQVKEDCRLQAQTWMQTHEAKPVSRWGVVWVLSVWSLCAYVLWLWLA